MLTTADRELLVRHTDAENAHQREETLATLAPDCVFEDMALGASYHGRDQAAEYYRMWWEGLDIEVAVERVHEIAGEPTVVAETTWHGRHIGSFLGIARTGRDVTIPMVIVAEIRDGLLARERLYWDRTTVIDQLTAEPAEHR